MNAYYQQIANALYPIYGVSSMHEAAKFAGNEGRIVESSENVYMNPHTGSVDFADNWMADVGAEDESELSEAYGLIHVEYDAESESWTEAR